MEFGSNLGFPHLNTTGELLMYLTELLILENLCLATNFMKLRVLELKLRLFIDIYKYGIWWPSWISSLKHSRGISYVSY